MARGSRQLRPKESKASTFWLGVALSLLGLVFATALLTAFLWHIARIPSLVLAALACAFGVYLVRGRPWAGSALLIVVLIQLAVSITLLVPLGLWLPLVLQTVFAVWLIILLVGPPTKRRAWISFVGLGCTLAAASYLLFGMFTVDDRRAAALKSAQHLLEVHSPAQYSLYIGDLPWSVLGQREAGELLGAEIKNADLQLVRNDATAFALFFPLHFRNMEYTPEIASLLQREIRQNWLGELQEWTGYPQEEGFLLRARGVAQGLELSYVVMYKHFGNLGVYAIVWGERRREPELLAEASRFYQQLAALPVKDRLGKVTAADVYRKYSDAVVLITVFDGEHQAIGKGTGFNVSSEGLILTNLHVVLPGHYLSVTFPNGDAYDDVRIAALSRRGSDLALLTINGSNLSVIQEARSVSVDPGDAVYVLGNPKGLVNSVSEGIVGAVRKDQDVIYYQITAPISVGSSGGPVFNQFGEVIGVATALIEDAQNLNFSLAIDEVEYMVFLPLPLTLLQLRQELEKIRQQR